MNAFTACSSLGLITPAALEFPTYTLRAGDSVRFVGERALSYQLKCSIGELCTTFRPGHPPPTQLLLLLKNTDKHTLAKPA